MINVSMLAWLLSGSAVAWVASTQQLSMAGSLLWLLFGAAALIVLALIRRQPVQ